LTFHLGNAPGGGGGNRHGFNNKKVKVWCNLFNRPVARLLVSKVTGPSWCEHPDPDVKGTTGLQGLRAELLEKQ
jgi:hypothetical protein